MPIHILQSSDKKKASLRMNTAQSFNGHASTIALIVVSCVFFFFFFFGGSEDESAGNLESVQWTYIGVACGMSLLYTL